jgi:hypothetical protein
VFFCLGREEEGVKRIVRAPTTTGLGPRPTDHPPSHSPTHYLLLLPLRADTFLIFADIINVSGRRLSTASALIMYKGVAETAGALPPPPGSFDADLTWGTASDRDDGQLTG